MSTFFAVVFLDLQQTFDTQKVPFKSEKDQKSQLEQLVYYFTQFCSQPCISGCIRHGVRAGVSRSLTKHALAIHDFLILGTYM